MKFLKLFRYIFIVIILLCFNTLVVSAEDVQNNKIQTNYVSMETLTDSFDYGYKLFTKNEIEDLINSSCQEILKDVDFIEINHSARDINIVYSINLSDDIPENTINRSLFDFIKSLNGFNYYDLNFEIYLKSVDKNYRTIKHKYASYTFNRETLSHLIWEDLTEDGFIKYADRIWTNIDGEQTIYKEKIVDELQLKILEIFKSYIQYKLIQK